MARAEPAEGLVRGGGAARLECPTRSAGAFNEEWPAKLFGGGWICATWPEEYGGKGLTTMRGRRARRGVRPRPRRRCAADFFGDTLVGPTLLQWGTEEQKQEFLPEILQGRDPLVPGLLASPNSGSDLASLKTSAVLDGDEWVINGQKVWTTRRPPRRLLLPADPHRSRRRRSTRASRTCSCRCASPASRCAASPSPTAPPSSARCSSPTPGARRTTSSAASTTAGRSPTRRSAFERGQSATTGYRRFEEEYRLMVDGGRRERSSSTTRTSASA